jgi:hypothetical protein
MDFQGGGEKVEPLEGARRAAIDMDIGLGWVGLG